MNSCSQLVVPSTFIIIRILFHNDTNLKDGVLPQNAMKQKKNKRIPVSYDVYLQLDPLFSEY